ncbi:prolyl oligopeptidase family protein [Sphingomonas sp. SUN039]|uniref:prolyl oligopeptidase family serine peptidase n=1 Tax=Sphingomonas sp. SUN039 TaxID=2937787 RepID=UPI002164DF22|nr:prolyl oligopeptidase family serine peptidase [Sphingomonas sp. SUN039]UVO55895.1 prolyl oligopeptidase family serine peptidase [Sphingomonas sp. SUN039]
MAETPLAYPETATVDVVETAFGEKVADPYRWLENDVRTDAKVRDWVTAENKVTDAYLATLPGREAFKTRMQALYNYERMGTPRKAGARYFYSHNSGLQNQSTLWVRDGLGGAGRLLLDPNLWAKDGATALAEWAPSDDGRYLAYAVQDGGTDWRTLKVIDAGTGKELADRIEWVKYSGIAWKPDGSGFFYSRFDAPKEGAKFQALTTNQQVWFHRIGTAQDADAMVYATPDRPKLGHGAQVTDDGKYLVISSSQGTDPKVEVTVAPLAATATGAGVGTPRTLVAGLDNNWELAGTVGSKFWYVTDKDAPKGRVALVDVAARAPKFKAVIPETANTLVGASLIGQRLVVAYLGDAKSEAELFELTGKSLGRVPLPDIGTAAGFGGRTGDSESFYTFTGFATPATVYRYDSATNRSTPVFQPKLAFDPAAFETQQVFYPSKDGTKIPMFVVRKKGLTVPASTLLYGYGGFNISMTPGFSATRLAWLEAGGVLAIANLRGGGEYGNAWHEAGKRAQKQNVFDDFIAAGEWLVAQGITTKAQLAIQGGSNGGLLVGAVVNQRPDLFAAALPAVGVMDMLRFNRFTAGRYWTDDYGDPGVEADWKVLRAYSPLHNIREGTAYPAILVTTADTDDRVVPGHSFKYAAALQAAKLGDRPQLIRIETRAGHGSGKPTDKIIEEAADQWAFIAKWTGMRLERPSVTSGLPKQPGS